MKEHHKESVLEHQVSMLQDHKKMKEESAAKQQELKEELAEKDARLDKLEKSLKHEKAKNEALQNEFRRSTTRQYNNTRDRNYASYERDDRVQRYFDSYQRMKDGK